MMRRDGSPLSPAEVEIRLRAWPDLAHALWEQEPESARATAARALLGDPAREKAALAAIDEEETAAGLRWLEREAAREARTEAYRGLPRYANWPYEVVGLPSVLDLIEGLSAEPES